MKRYRSHFPAIRLWTALVFAFAGTWAGGCGDENGDDTTGNGASSVNSPGCGDGKVDPGEECDDGPLNADTAECTSACKKAHCGDGFVLTDKEKCDNGGYNSDTAACTAWCNIAYCGDHFIQEGVEECDEGSDNGNNAACSLTCKLAP